MSAQQDGPLDASVPSAARIYDYLLGGKDNFAADRDLAARLEAAGGDGAGVRDLAKVTRRFVLAATTRAVSLGVMQVIDLGAGLPRDPSVDATARSSGYQVKVAYADKDPMALSHLSALCRAPGVAVVDADVSEPGKVLADPGLLDVIDLDEPVLILLGGTLSAMTAQAARDTVAGYSAAVVPGSRFAVSCASWRDPVAGARMAALFSVAGEWHNHSRADIRSFFEAGGLTTAPGADLAVNLRYWPAVSEKCRDAGVLGGVGVRV